MNQDMTNIAKEVASIVEAINSGVPLGMFRAGDPAPTLPHVPMMILVDDRKGEGPLKFDIGPLLAQVDAVIFAGPDTFELGARVLAISARANQRVLMVATKAENLADWLEIIIGTRLMRNFFLAGASENAPPRVAEIVNEIEKICDRKAH